MTMFTRILLIASLVCFLAWGAVVLFGVRVLVPAQEVKVIYGVHEDFFSDARVFRKHRNDTFFLLHCPRARPEYRWWSVDFAAQTVSSASPPRTVRSVRYVVKGDLAGTNIADRAAMGEWNWHFTEAGAAFSGNGFTCSVRKTEK